MQSGRSWDLSRNPLPTDGAGFQGDGPSKARSGIEIMKQYTTDDGVNLAYRLDGPDDAPGIVLSHALGADHHMWDALTAALAGEYRVIRYDARGHGASDAPDEDYSIERLGMDVVGLLDAVGQTRAAYCGLSLGGMVGQWLGARAGGRLTRLVLANTSAYAGPDIWAPRVELARAKGMAPLVEGTLERWFTPSFHARSPEAVDTVRSVLRATSNVGYAGSAAAIRDMDLRPLGPLISVSTLVICGAHDLATPPERARLLADSIPDARLVELDAAHLSNVEQPDAFEAALRHFLA
jgi:3-oxoadipate enol-lactonase